MKKLSSLLLFGALAACQTQPEVGYIKLSLPQSADFKRAAASATIQPAEVSTWLITVSAEDMEEPIVVTTTETEITVPVPAGEGRIVHVSARGAEADGISQGYDGESTVDVAEDADTEVTVDVFRSVTVSDANAPLDRSGKEASASAPDVESLTLTIGSEGLHVFLMFANDVAAPWNSSRENTIRGLIEFDLDRNAQTGGVSLVQGRNRTVRALTGSEDTDLPVGVDLTLDLSPTAEGYVRLLTADTAIPLAAQFGAGILSIEIPYDHTNGPVQALRLVGLIAGKSGSTDFLPEKDFVEIAVTASEPPAATLRAITSFSSNFVKSFGSLPPGTTSLPSLAITSSPVGLHAAWETLNGVEYSLSTNGELFPITQSFNGRAGFDIEGIDVAASAQGEPAVVVSSAQYTVNGNFCDGPCDVKVDFFGHDGTQFLASLEIPAGLQGFNQPALAEFSGASALVVEPNSGLTMNVHHVDGATLGAAANLGDVIMAGFGSGTNGPLVAVHIQSWNGQAYSNWITVSSVSGGPVVAPVATIPLADGFPYFGTIDVAGTADNVYLLVEEYNVLTVYDKTGAVVAFPAGANLITYHGAGYTYPKLEASPLGRVGVVWHSGTNLMVAPPIPLAPGQNGPQEIWYSELLPGQTQFGEPVFVGAGADAAFAYDPLGRPVVLVVGASIDQFSGIVSTANLTAFRGE